MTLKIVVTYNDKNFVLTEAVTDAKDRIANKCKIGDMLFKDEDDNFVVIEDSHENYGEFLKAYVTLAIDEENPDVYVSNGYIDRMHYLSCMAEDYDITLDALMFLANLLGPNEDFDGLVSALEDGDYEY